MRQDSDSGLSRSVLGALYTPDTVRPEKLISKEDSTHTHTQFAVRVSAYIIRRGREINEILTLTSAFGLHKLCRVT